MTSIAHRYADFSVLGVEPEFGEPVTVGETEENALQAFEEGYQAGWTDAEKNRSDEQNNIGEEFLHTLRDLSFTYQESLALLNRGLKPMFENLIAAFLPKMASAALRAHVIEQLMELAGAQTNAQVNLQVSESNLPMFEELLEDADLKIDVALSSDMVLSPNQLFVSVGTTEREINLDAVCQEIVQAMNAFNFHSQTEYPDA